MSNNTEALIASIKDTIDDAARLYGDKWDSALVGGEPNYHAITSEKTNDVVVRTSDDSRESSWLCDYLESVSPANVKALIAALEQAQHKEAVNWEAAASLVEENEELKRRIAELTAALEQADQRVDELENDEVRQRLANAEHQLHMAELAKHNLKASRKAQFRKRIAAERRVAELEARKLSVKPVKLPGGYAIRAGHPINEDERSVMIPKEGGGWLSRFDVEHAIRAAGGTVEGE